MFKFFRFPFKESNSVTFAEDFCWESNALCFFFNNLFSIIPVVWYKVFPLPTNLVLPEQHAVHFQVKDWQIHGCYRTISRANNAVRKEFLRLQATDREYKQAKRKIKTNSVQQAYLMFSALSYVIFSPAQVTSISVR